jgi:2-hydroxyethylphosphonate dioxygenase
VAHRWLGRGSVLRFGSGAHLGSFDWLELTNTFDARGTLLRGRHDTRGWGYQAGGG